jgi:hypothetical protein
VALADSLLLVSLKGGKTSWEELRRSIDRFVGCCGIEAASKGVSVEGPSLREDEPLVKMGGEGTGRKTSRASVSNAVEGPGNRIAGTARVERLCETG